MRDLFDQSEDGAQKVRVQFTLDGEFYNIVYDVATGVIARQ